MLGVGGDDLAVLGMDRGGDHRLTAAGDTGGHHQRLGRAGRAVVHGGVGHVHAGQLADHGLELEDRLQRTLGDLRLVRGVGGEEFSAGDERIDDDRAVVRVGARAQEGGIALRAFGGALAEELHDLAFGVGARNLEVGLQTVFGGNGRKQVVNRFRADFAEHGFAVGLRFRKIAHGYLWLSWALLSMQKNEKHWLGSSCRVTPFDVT